MGVLGWRACQLLLHFAPWRGCATDTLLTGPVGFKPDAPGGNPADDTGRGAVLYAYWIGTTEVTNPSVSSS